MSGIGKLSRRVDLLKDRILNDSLLRKGDIGVATGPVRVDKCDLHSPINFESRNDYVHAAVGELAIVVWYQSIPESAGVSAYNLAIRCVEGAALKSNLERSEERRVGKECRL